MTEEERREIELACYERRRSRTLTDADVQAIAAAVQGLRKHECRFDAISQEDLASTVAFKKHVNDLMAETGSTIRKTLVVVGLGGLVSLLMLGIYAKVKEIIG